MSNTIDMYDGVIDGNRMGRGMETGETNPGGGNMILGLLRRWKMILLVFLLLVAVGVPPVWLFVPKQYRASAAIQIKPVINSFLFSDEQSDRPMPAYSNFVNTQADLMTSQIVLGEVANLLQKETLSIFAPKPGGFKALLQEVWRKRDATLLLKEDMSPEDTLRQLVSSGKLTVAPRRDSELMIISMEHSSGTEATLIVDAFIKAYQIKIVEKMEQGSSKKLMDLEKERDNLRGDVTTAQEEVLQLASKYGTRDLQRRQELIYDQMSEMNRQMAAMRDERITLESQVRELEQTGTIAGVVDTAGLQQDKMLKQKQYISADPLYQNLTQSLIRAQEQQMVAAQELAPNNPEILRVEERIKSIQTRLDARRQELLAELGGAVPDAAPGTNTVQEQMNLIREEKLAAAKQSLEKLKNDIILFEDQYKSLTTEANTIGQDQLKMLALEDKLGLNKNIYDTLCSRIEQLKIEQNRPGRIEIAYNATSLELSNKKIKLLAGVIFGALACGLGLAFLLNKMDHSVRTTRDVTRTVGLPIIGTTISSRKVDRKLLPEYINNDYQNIRANLSILSEGQIYKKLAVASAGPREGKTTLAINLAASLAQTGCKVLLIDGDLRKQGIRQTLRLPAELKGFYEVVMGECGLEDAIFFYPNAGFSIMVGSCRASFDPVDLLSRKQTAESMELIARQYDHVIIDTPPVLLAPDALLWGKLVDAVVLSSFSGTTAAPALKDALDKFSAAHIKVLGNVLSNVDSRSIYGYYGYGYGHGSGQQAAKNDKRLADSNALMIQGEAK